MTWKNGNLICDWCDKVVIHESDVTEHDIEFHVGWTRCKCCCENQDPSPKSGILEDLLKTDYFAPNDPSRQFHSGKITLEEYVIEMKKIFPNWKLLTMKGE